MYIQGEIIEDSCTFKVRSLKISVADPDSFDTDTDPCRFKGVIYLKPYFLYICTSFCLSVGPTGPTLTLFFVEFSLQVNIFVLMRVAYGSGS